MLSSLNSILRRFKRKDSVEVHRLHEVQGGLGNQMFQVALALVCQAKLGGRSSLSLNYFTDHPCHNGWEVSRLFEFSTQLEVKEYEDVVKCREVAGADQKIYDDTHDMRFNSAIFSQEYLLYRGYYQSYKYFSGYEALIRENFRFKLDSDVDNKVLEEIRSDDSVFVHVRRGDYLSSNNAKFFGGVCTDAYYQRCIEYIKERVPSARFYIFTNDVDWCRENFRGEEFSVVEGNGGVDSWKDMYLMSQCKHAVIANSSFSWWGMWLGERDEAIVCGPSRFFNKQLAEHSIDDLLPEYVTKVNEKGEVVVDV